MSNLDPWLVKNEQLPSTAKILQNCKKLFHVKKIDLPFKTSSKYVIDSFNNAF